MADRSLSRVFFPLLRLTSDDATRTVDDPIGYFSCRESTARFLDIEKKIVNALVNYEVTPTRTRILTLADGTVLKAGKENSDNKAAPYKKAQAASKGAKTVRLITGKAIRPVAEAGSGANNKHTISFRFPAFATILTISDALGTLIPNAHIKSSPTADDIYPFFISPGGRRYPIMTKAAADNSTEAEVATSTQELTQLTAKTGSKKGVIPGAGGNA
jgi:hypothetical protein